MADLCRASQPCRSMTGLDRELGTVVAEQAIRDFGSSKEALAEGGYRPLQGGWRARRRMTRGSTSTAMGNPSAVSALHARRRSAFQPQGHRIDLDANGFGRRQPQDRLDSSRAETDRGTDDLAHGLDIRWRYVHGLLTSVSGFVVLWPLGTSPMPRNASVGDAVRGSGVDEGKPGPGPVVISGIANGGGDLDYAHRRRSRVLGSMPFYRW